MSKRISVSFSQSEQDLLNLNIEDVSSVVKGLIEDRTGFVLSLNGQKQIKEKRYRILVSDEVHETLNNYASSLKTSISGLIKKILIEYIQIEASKKKKSKVIPMIVGCRKHTTPMTTGCPSHVIPMTVGSIDEEGVFTPGKAPWQSKDWKPGIHPITGDKWVPVPFQGDSKWPYGKRPWR